MTIFRSARLFCVVVWILQLVCCVAFCSQLSNTSSISRCQDHIDENDCEFYRCIEARMQCGEEGYPLRYGYKYCQRFAERSRHFNNKVSLYICSLFIHKLILSLQGRQWIFDVMECLMKDVNGSKIYRGLLTSSSCNALERMAFQSHSSCYINNGFCSVILHWTNMKEFVKVLQFPDIFSWNFVQQVM